MNLAAWIARRLSAVAGATRGRSRAAIVLLVAIGFGVSRVLGLVRETIIAAQFGTSSTYDAYLAAFRIPDTLYYLVMSGAFGAAFIPTFGGFLARGESEQAWRLANTVLTYAATILVIAALLILVFADTLVGTIVAPALPPASQALAADLSRLLLFSPLLLGLGAMSRGMLEAHDAFTLSAIAPILYNLGIIFGAAVLAPFLGVYGLAIGAVLGAAMLAVTQLTALLRFGLRYRPSFSLRTAGLGEVARLMPPRVGSLASGQINQLVITNFASRLGPGRISAMSYAYSLALLPHGVLALSTSMVVFPLLVRQYGRGQLDLMRGTLHRVLESLLFLILPATIGLFAFRESIIQVVLQYGSFDRESTVLVATALAFIVLGLPARVLSEPIIRSFYAMHDTRTPLLASVLMVMTNFTLCSTLAPLMGLQGLALSSALSQTLRMAVLLTILSRRTGGLARGLVRSVLRMLPALLAMALVALALGGPVASATDPADGRTVWTYVVFVVAIAAVGAVYLGAAYYLRIPAVHDLIERVRRRIAR